jgi:hypothetical protein
MQPWAAALYKERHDSFGRDKPQVRCLPHGVPDAMLVPGYPKNFWIKVRQWSA